MTDEENKLEAMKSELLSVCSFAAPAITVSRSGEIEKLKQKMKADVKSVSGIEFEALAVMSTLLRKLPEEDTWTALDIHRFKIPVPWKDEMTAAMKDIIREVYEVS